MGNLCSNTAVEKLSTMGNVLRPTKVVEKSTVQSPPWFKDGKELVVLTLNMDNYHKYCAAKDKASYEQYLKKQLDGVDVLCVQEDLLFWSDKFLKKNGPYNNFHRIISSTDQEGVRPSKLKEMVYETHILMETMKKSSLPI